MNGYDKLDKEIFWKIELLAAHLTRCLGLSGASSMRRRKGRSSRARTRHSQDQDSWHPRNCQDKCRRQL